MKTRAAKMRHCDHSLHFIACRIRGTYTRDHNETKTSAVLILFGKAHYVYATHISANKEPPSRGGVREGATQASDFWLKARSLQVQ